MLYRYEFVEGNTKTGLLVGLDDYFTTDEILSVCWIFELKLNSPGINMKNTKSYFTDRGNRKFRKMIRKIRNIAKTKNLDVVCVKVSEEGLNNVVYKDQYQVVIKI